MRDEVVRYQHAGLHQVHGSPDELGRVVERAEQRQLLVMRPTRVQTDRGSGRAAAEEYHVAAPARRVDRLLPHLGPARRVDRDVRARAAGGGADGCHDVVGLRRVEAFADPEPSHPCEPPAGLSDQDDTGLARGRHHPEETAERTRAEDDDGLARLHPRPLDAEERTRHRLGERRARGREPGPEPHDVLRHEPWGKRDELTVRAVNEQEVVAQVRAARQARAARAARCRVRGDDAVALADTPDAGADRRDGARELVAEDRGDLRNHDRVATTERLDVRPAGERRVDPEHQLAGLRLGHRELLRAEVARAVEHHRPHGVTYTLSASRRRIRSTPRSRPGSVTRWVTSPSTDTSPATISRNASARSDGDDEYVAVRVSSRW